MKVKTNSPNPNLTGLIKELKKKSLDEGVDIWKRIAQDMEKPSQKRRIINLYKINHFANDGETVLVPGKVLGMGEIDKKIKIAAFNFSSQALEKIEKSDSESLTIKEVMEKNPKGEKVRILG